MSQASAAALLIVGRSLQEGGGRDAAAMRVAESYVAAIANVAKAGNTMLLPTASNDPAAATAAAMSIFNQASSPPPPPHHHHLLSSSYLFWHHVLCHVTPHLQVLKTGTPVSSGNNK